MNPGAPRTRAARVAVVLALAGLVAGFAALGTWQLQRRQWKLALIEQVEQRVHAPVVAAPGPAQWQGIGPQDAYRRVRVAGEYLADRDTRVQAVTDLGPGWWVLSPMRTDDGAIVLVNRGFVDSGHAQATPPAAGPQSVTGLLRLSEPGGGFLRHNDPAAERWYSRDVAAIAARRGLEPVAPYFVDAERDPNAPADGPVGGLTVVRFRNEHLVYALTWFALAAMSAGGLILSLRASRADGAEAANRG